MASNSSLMTLISYLYSEELPQAMGWDDRINDELAQLRSGKAWHKPVEVTVTVDLPVVLKELSSD